MSSLAIKVDNLWKQYRLGHYGHGMLYKDIQSFMAKARGKDDPHAKISDDEALQVRENVDGDRLWALRDISFEVKTGERLGIIGLNGAGKSTLLKLITGVTTPTKGSIRLNGRISSLLEVGTGFHPELTGRENIYLNGAILGMKRHEITQRLDEIIDFSEVSDFIDTPVKRYSSGMYVRLAFSVAAHLEPEILILDEVLAVGDAKFQKKCITKMKEISQSGQTLLFVSHSMSTITSICHRAILLEKGRLVDIGPSEEIIMRYFAPPSGPTAQITEKAKNNVSFNFKNTDTPCGDEKAKLIEGKVFSDTDQKSGDIMIDSPVSISMVFEVMLGGVKYIPNFHFYREDGTCVFISSPSDCRPLDTGNYTAVCNIPGSFLNDGRYFVGLALSNYENDTEVHFYEKDILSFTIVDPIVGISSRHGYGGPIPGTIRPQLDWTMTFN